MWTFIIGTRPEAIKLAPVILKAREKQIDTRVVLTGQHPEMAEKALASFGIHTQFNLHVVHVDLRDSLGHLLVELASIDRQLPSDVIFVQGDTTSTLAGALMGFYGGTPVVHVEAGLRTRDLSKPFPEEANRRMVASIASLHFAPSEVAAENLLNEGVQSMIHVVGNTVVDAVKLLDVAPKEFDRRTIFLTLHRREVHGVKMQEMLQAIQQAVEQLGDTDVVFPVHPHSSVRGAVKSTITSPHFHLVEPMEYEECLAHISGADLVLTDSGGIQEEAVTLKTPLLVLRDTTERVEGIRAGAAMITSTHTGSIESLILNTLNNPRTTTENPYGDGNAAERIVDLTKLHFPVPGE